MSSPERGYRTPPFRGDMRTVWAFIATSWSSAALVAAAVAVLIAGIAVLGFHDWPSDAATGAPGAVGVAAAEAHSDAAHARTPIGAAIPVARRPAGDAASPRARRL